MSVTQRLLNALPLTTKARTDPSSMGARTFSIWGDYFNYQYADTKRTADDHKLLKKGLGIGYVYQIILNEDDLIQSTTNNAGVDTYSYPSSVVGDGYTVRRVEHIDDLAWALTDRIVLSDTLGIDDLVIYSDDRISAPILNAIDYASHFSIKISDSTDYYKKTQRTNPRASRVHRLIIKGRDVNGSIITENVDILDDGNFWTANVWTEVDEVIPEGFNGDIELSIGKAQAYVTDPYKICVNEDAVEGPLRLSLETHSSDLGTLTKMIYWTPLVPQGEQYRDGSPELGDNRIVQWEQYLLDEDGDPFTGIAVAVNPNTTNLYCVSADGRVHIYEHGVPAFGPPTDQSLLTKVTYLETIPVSYYARYGQSMRLFTRFVRARFPVEKVSIKRRSPSGVVEYLQADMSWAAGYWEHLGAGAIEQLPEQTWGDFGFTTMFDEFGQWEFYTTTKTPFDVTVAYTAVLVDGLSALRTFDLEVSDPLNVWFDSQDRLVITSGEAGPDGEAYTFYVFTEHRDVYLPDPIQQLIYFRESYSSVELNDTYTPELISVGTGLDELGIHLGLTRLSHESLYNYQRRLILETREPAGPTEKEFIASLSRQVGLFDQVIFEIDLVRDGDDIPLAADPYVEITSSYLRAYSDYANEVIDVEVNFYDRDSAYFLIDLQDAFSGSIYFTITSLIEGYEHLYSRDLRYSKSDVHVVSELLLNSTQNQLEHSLIKNFYPSDQVAFLTLKNDVSALTQSGDYHVDETAGVVYTYDVQSGYVSYTYRDFPFAVVHQGVPAYPYLDVDKKEFHYDDLVSDQTGVPTSLLLNDIGASIANAVLSVHNLNWGE